MLENDATVFFIIGVMVVIGLVGYIVAKDDKK